LKGISCKADYTFHDIEILSDKTEGCSVILVIYGWSGGLKNKSDLLPRPKKNRAEQQLLATRVPKGILEDFLAKKIRPIELKIAGLFLIL
jgi:hypothetical protein